MGQWNITIQGHGIHDNGRPDDADNMTVDFIKKLEEAGHEIEAAHFTVGAARTYKSAIGDYLSALDKNIRKENA